MSDTSKTAQRRVQGVHALGCVLILTPVAALALVYTKSIEAFTLIWLAAPFVIFALEQRRSHFWSSICSIVAASTAFGVGTAYVLFASILSWQGVPGGRHAAGTVEAVGTSIVLRGEIDERTPRRGQPRFRRRKHAGRRADRVRGQAHGSRRADRAGSRCESACISIFSAGTRRVADPSASLMFHGTGVEAGIPFVRPLMFHDHSLLYSLARDLSGFPALKETLEKCGVFDSLVPVRLSPRQIAVIEPGYLTVSPTPPIGRNRAGRERAEEAGYDLTTCPSQGRRNAGVFSPRRNDRMRRSFAPAKAGPQAPVRNRA